MQGNFSIKAQNKGITQSCTCKKFYNSATVPSYFYDSTLATCISIILFFLSLSATQFSSSFFSPFFSLILSFFILRSHSLSNSLSFKACHRSQVARSVIDVKMGWSQWWRCGSGSVIDGGNIGWSQLWQHGSRSVGLGWSVMVG